MNQGYLVGEETLSFPRLIEANITRAKNRFLNTALTYGTYDVQGPPPFISIDTFSFLFHTEAEIRPQGHEFSPTPRPCSTRVIEEFAADHSD